MPSRSHETIAEGVDNCAVDECPKSTLMACPSPLGRTLAQPVEGVFANPLGALVRGAFAWSPMFRKPSLALVAEIGSNAKTFGCTADPARVLLGIVAGEKSVLKSMHSPSSSSAVASHVVIKLSNA
jgi:hypothetical protein